MRNLKALFCLVISNHLTLITNTSSLFIYCTICFGYRQPTFISHLLIGLSPCTFLEDGRLLSEEVKTLTQKNNALFNESISIELVSIITKVMAKRKSYWMILQWNLRLRGPSNSQKNTPCHVPSTNFPLEMTSVCAWPTVLVFKCAAVFPSIWRSFG